MYGALKYKQAQEDTVSEAKPPTPQNNWKHIYAFHITLPFS